MKQSISIFKNAASKNSGTATAHQIYKAIAEGRWKSIVEAIRQKRLEGNKKEVARLKKQLVYVLFTGVAVGGHRASQLTTYTGKCVLDYDDVQEELLEPFRELAMGQPFTECAFVTVSGRGLKVVVQTDATREQHAMAYAQVSEFYNLLLGIACDGACKDISHGHFISSDPNATFRQVTELFAVNRLPIAPPAPVLPPAPAVRIVPMGEIKEFVHAYLTLNPASEGKRNHCLFRLACEASKRGYPLEAVTLEAHDRMGSPDFELFEIRQTVKSAYSRVVEKETENEGRNGAVTAKRLYSRFENAILVDEESGDADGEELREQTPTFPKEVFEAIPEFLQTSLLHCDDARERDTLLLAIITALSGMFYNADGFYARKLYSPNLYTLVIAPPASGKGIMENAMTLCKYYFEEVNAANEKLTKAYKEELEAYEESLREHRGKKSKTENVEKKTKPEPPVYFFPHIPVNTSKSRFVSHLKENGARGGLMFSLEADTLSGANKQDYGDFMEMFRNIFHHEMVSNSFVKDGIPVYVQHPKLSLHLAGTPSQLIRLIPTTENGNFSRFLTYTHRQPIYWKDVSPGEDEEEVMRHFDQLSMRLHQMIRFLNTSHTRVKLSRGQWDTLNSVFSELLGQSSLSDRDDFQGCVKRHGLMAFRICMVFTLLEKGSFRMDVKELECTTQHFQAALSIVTTCLEHGRLLITSIPKSDKGVLDLQNPDKMKSIFQVLPDVFTYAEYIQKAAQFGLTERNARKLLKGCIDLTVKKIRRGEYQKRS